MPTIKFQAEDAMSNAMRSVAQVMQNLGSVSQTVAGAVANLGQGLGLANQTASASVARFNDLRNAYSQAQARVQELASSVSGAKTRLLEMRENVLTLETQLTKAKNATGANSQAVKELSVELQQARTSTKEFQLNLSGLEAEYKKAQTEAKQYENTLKQAGQQTKETSTHTNAAKDSMSGLAGALGLPITPAAAATAGIAALGVGSIKLAADFDQSMAKLQVASGVLDKSSAEYKQLSDVAKKVGQDTKFSSKEAADGMTVLGQAGLNTKEILAAIGPAAQAAEINEVGLAEASNTLTTVMKAFGLEADKTTHIVDLTTKAAGISALSFNDFNLAMGAVGSVAKLSNQSLEATTSAVISLRNAGQSAQDAGTSIKSALLALTNPSDAAAGAIQQLGLKIYDSNGKMRDWSDIIAQVEKATKGMTDAQRNQMLATIAGSDGIRAFAGGLNATATAMVNGKEVTLKGAEALKYWEEQLKNSDGTAKKAAETLRSTFAAQLDNLKGSLEEAGISIGKALLPGLADATKKITEMINNLSNSLQPVLDKITPILSGIMSAYMQYIQPVIKGIMEGFQQAFAILQPALDKLGEAFKGTGLDAKSLGDFVGGALKTAIIAIADVIKFWVDRIVDLKHAFDTIKPVLDVILIPIKGAFEGIKAAIKFVVDAAALIPNPFQDAAKSLKATWEEGDKASSSFGKVADKAKDLTSKIQGTNQQLAQTPPATAQAKNALDIALGALNKFGSTSQETGAKVTDVAKSVTALGAQTQKSAQQVKVSSDQIAESMKNGMTAAQASAQSGAEGVKQAVDTTIGQLPASTETAMQGVDGAIQTGVDSAASSVQAGGATISDSFITALKNMHEGIVESLNDIAITAREIAPTIAKAIMDNAHVVGDAMGKVQDEVKASGDKIVNVSKEVGKEIVDALGVGFGGLQNTLNKLDSDFQKFFDKMTAQAAQNGAAAGKAYSSNLAANTNLGPGGGISGMVGEVAPSFTGGQSVGMGDPKAIQQAVFGHKMQTADDFKGSASSGFLQGRMGISGGDTGGGSLGNFMAGRGNYYDPEASKPINLTLNLNGQTIGQAVGNSQTGNLKSRLGTGNYL